MIRIISIISLLLLYLTACQPLSQESAVSRRVYDRLSQQTDLGFHDLIIDDHRGSVVLRGTVGSYQARTKIEQLTLDTKGVKEVDNQLTVIPQAGGSGQPGEILLGIRSAISARKDLGNHQLNLQRNGNNITIQGTASSQRDADIIEQIVRDTPGVMGVANELYVRGPITDDMLRTKVINTLRAEPNFDLPATVQTSVSNGVVNFSGTVQRRSQIDQIIALTLMIKGVKDVKSSLRVR